MYGCCGAMPAAVPLGVISLAFIRVFWKSAYQLLNGFRSQYPIPVAPGELIPCGVDCVCGVDEE
jgi:hypothetical protein